MDYNSKESAEQSEIKKKLYSNLQSAKLMKICHKNFTCTQSLVRITESHKTGHRTRSEGKLVIDFTDLESTVNLWPSR